jgi:hypothetical protein
VPLPLELRKQFVEQHHLAAAGYEHLVHPLCIVHVLQLGFPEERRGEGVMGWYRVRRGRDGVGTAKWERRDLGVESTKRQ